MNNNILDDVMQVSGSISPWTVIALILITIVGAVVLIPLCGAAIAAVKKLVDRLLGRKD